MQDGRHTRDSTPVRPDLQLHPSQASGDNINEEGHVAPPASPKQGVRRGASALEETLGNWLNNNHQAEIQALQRARDRAEIGADLYKEMWDTSLTGASNEQQRLLTQIESRDMVINMLHHTVYKMLHRTDFEDIRDRMDTVSGFIDELLNNSLDASRHTSLVSTYHIFDMIRQDEQHEIIDLTGSDDEDTDTDMED